MLRGYLGISPYFPLLLHLTLAAERLPDHRIHRQHFRPREAIMLELLYGAKDFDRVAWKEIDEGRSVALRVTGWKKARIHRILSLYSEYDYASRNGVNRRSLLFSLGWRAILAPSIIGLCNHARLAGMSVVVQDKGSTLKVRFEKAGQKV